MSALGASAGGWGVYYVGTGEGRGFPMDSDLSV